MRSEANDAFAMRHKVIAAMMVCLALGLMVLAWSGVKVWGFFGASFEKFRIVACGWLSSSLCRKFIASIVIRPSRDASVSRRVLLFGDTWSEWYSKFNQC